MTDFVLETKYVFVDTNIYEGKNFQFLTYELERLSLLASAGEIVLLMSPIIDFEIRNHIKAGAVKAAKSIKDFTKEAMVLRNTTELPVSGVFERVSALDISTALLENYSRFIELARAEVISFEDVNPAEVFERYFLELAPFSEGKKHEFPDGFVCFSLLNYSRQENARIYVVSDDRDMRNFCCEHESLIYLDSLNPIIDALAHLGPYEPASFADQMFDRLECKIVAAAKHYLNSLEFDTDRMIDDVIAQSFSFEMLQVLERDMYEVRVGHAEYDVVIGLEVWAHQVVDDLGDFESEWCFEEYIGVERSRQISKFKAVVDMRVMLVSEGYKLESVYLCDVDPVLRSDLSLQDAFSVEILAEGSAL